ncbi:HdeD family acid-resistance protein [Halomonas sp. 1390]|uniref:HdeD family acid-resistance protein n=1 Tax=Halomonas sp. B23F22_3 TaxID=3459516 RepID=UPI00373F4B58
MILGVLSVGFGLLVLANPVAASLAVTTLAGILFAVSGGFQIFAGFGESKLVGKVLGMALGAVMLLLGLSLLFRPLEGIISLAALVTILFAASGVARVVTSFQMRHTSFFWPMLVSGALSVLLAIFIVANFFQIAPNLLGILLGIELLFNGAGLIALSFFLRAGLSAERHTTA